MTSTAEKINQLLTLDLTGDSEASENFRAWFLQQFNKANCLHQCSLEDFAVYFVNAIRMHTEVHLRTNETDTPKCKTPKCTTPVRSTKAVVTNSNASSSTPKRVLPQYASNPILLTPIKTLTVNSEKESRSSLEDSFQNQKINNSQLLECDEHSFSHSLQSNTSTPVRRAPSSSSINNHSQNRRSANNLNGSVCSTPNSSEKTARSSNLVGASSSICLGDFLINSRCSKKTNTNSGGKPKKRVVPTTITSYSSADSTPFINNSTFGNENNILKISSTEIDDKNKCSILKARKALKQNAEEISRELGNPIIDSKKINASISVPGKEITTHLNHVKLLSAIKMQNAEQRAVVERIAAIYSTLMDMNFTTNVLNEISFLINILNAIDVDTESGGVDDVSASMKYLELDSKLQKTLQAAKCDSSNMRGLDVLRNNINCIYFTLCVLNSQRNVLGVLDLKSLGVVLGCERLLTLSEDLKIFLDNIYQSKQNELQLFVSDDDFSTAPFDRSFSNVYYQEDSDSRQNFPSNNEFSAFKSQRDAFYNALKCWECNHLNVAWDFQKEIMPKINEIFNFSEHPVNMAHLAELFVSQLLISANYTTSPEEIGVDIDLQKFTKLTQRLVAPSNFSVDFKFPDNQAFFRDFIHRARSIAFLEQLKLAIYSKLIALNDSTLELLDMDKDEDEDSSESYRNEFIVRPKVLSSLQVLAKFLGYVTVLPFNYCSGTPSEPFSCFDKPQIELRSLLQSNLNLERLLKVAMENRKLLITLPWLVQYLAMLDNVTLQMDNYIAVTQLMFSIYIKIDAFKLPLASTAVFIIRCCLGWLFDTKPILTEQYYNFRMTCHQGKHKDMTWLEKLPLFNSASRCTLENQIALSPILEPFLIVACPFLAEFRVSIMPAKCAVAKYVSRSGRYRHITTRMPELQASKGDQSADHSDALNIQAKRKLSENKLIEAFLHSQNSTVRRLIEFITERVYRSTTKDAQFKILLPSKTAADCKVNNITSSQYTEVSKAVHAIYQEALLSAVKQWDASVPNIIKNRITLALDALLPTDTEPIVKYTYFHLIRCNSFTKINQWKQTNLFSTNFYCSNFEDLIQKISKVNSKAQKPSTTSTELVIIKHEPSVSSFLDELQNWLHCTSLRPERMPGIARLTAFLRQFPQVFENRLPTDFYRIVGAGTVQLMQNLIALHPTFLTADLIDAFQSMWSSSEMKKHAIEVHDQQTDRKFHDCEMSENRSISDRTPSIFDGFVTISFIESLGSNKISFGKFKEVLLAMIQANLITVDFVNVLFVPIFKQDWHSSVLNEISIMLQGIANETVACGGVNANANYDDIKSNLFMEVLADFAKDVDNF